VARITFQKRQKEMKRQEKQRLKAEKRAQRKMAKSAESEAAAQDSSQGPINLDTADTTGTLADSPVDEGHGGTESNAEHRMVVPAPGLHRGEGDA
jgi:hypothetical protein